MSGGMGGMDWGVLLYIGLVGVAVFILAKVVLGMK